MLANRYLNDNELVVLLVIDLESKKREIGVNFKSKALEKQLTITPPSLYVIERNSEMWEEIIRNQRIKVTGISNAFTVYYDEVKRDDGDYSRGLFVLPVDKL